MSTILPTTFILGYAGSIGIVSEKTFAPGLTNKNVEIYASRIKLTMLNGRLDWKRNAHGANIATQFETQIIGSIFIEMNINVITLTMVQFTGFRWAWGNLIFWSSL